MTDMEINIGLQVTKQTPVNKGDFKQCPPRRHNFVSTDDWTCNFITRQL